MSKLDKVVKIKMGLGCFDSFDALVDIALSIDNYGLWNFAKMFRVLDENESAEEFAIEFYTAYNKEVRFRY